VARRYRLAVLGGTFDHFHIGHQALVSTAFRIGDVVAIGLTTDRFLAEHPKPASGRIQPFSARRAVLTRWVGRAFPRRSWTVVPLEDAFGRSLEPEVDVLVVSPDTLSGGRAVNRERRRLGRRPLPIKVVPLALGDDLEPVSSRRIRAGEVRPDGRRSSPIRVELWTDDARDAVPALRALRRAFPRIIRTVGPRRSPGYRRTAGLTVIVRRPPSGGRVVAISSPRIRLPPVAVRTAGPGPLERTLFAQLRPRDERKVFGTHRSSSR
jgi:pantetheine-phosphate adenylyltransferase